MTLIKTLKGNVIYMESMKMILTSCRFFARTLFQMIKANRFKTDFKQSNFVGTKENEPTCSDLSDTRFKKTRADAFSPQVFDPLPIQMVHHLYYFEISILGPKIF